MEYNKTRFFIITFRTVSVLLSGISFTIIKNYGQRKLKYTVQKDKTPNVINSDYQSPKTHGHQR